MKVFSLMNGDQLRLAPKTRVLKADDFSELVDAEELLEKLQEDMRAYRQKVAEESEEAAKKAQEEGFEQGLSQWSDQLRALEERLERVQGEMEKAIVPLAISAAKKIVGRELAEKPETIVDIVRQALKALSQDKQFVIFVNKADMAALEESKAALKDALEHARSITLRVSDEVAKGDCAIETENGILKVEAEKQWKALEAAFRSYVKDQDKTT